MEAHSSYLNGVTLMQGSSLVIMFLRPVITGGGKHHSCSDPANPVRDVSATTTQTTKSPVAARFIQEVRNSACPGTIGARNVGPVVRWRVDLSQVSAQAT